MRLRRSAVAGLAPPQAPGPDAALTLVPFGAETLRITELPVLAASQTMARRARPAAAGATTLVELYAPWCAACRTVRRAALAAALRLGPTVHVERVDVDRSPEAALRGNVDALPSFVVVRDGAAIAKHVGVASADALVQLVARAGVRYADKD